MRQEHVGLWCADNVIRFTDHTVWSDTTPTALLSHAMTCGKIAVYVTDPSVLNGFMAHVIAHMPHNQHRAYMSWDAIISKTGRFFMFSVTIDKDNWLKFYEVSNLLRDGYRVTLDEDGNMDMQLLDIIAMYQHTGLAKITAGSASMSAYHGGDYPWYLSRFPQLEAETKKTLHGGYIGGFMIAKEGHYGAAIDIDCNSMYPSILRDEFLPYGTPERYDGEYTPDKDMPLHADTITFRADLKPDGYPFLSDGHTLTRGANRLISTHGYVTMTLTDIDQKLLIENYDVSIYKRHGGWKFRQSKGVFTGFIDEWGTRKQKETGNRRQMAKLVMNALVGKMAALPKGAVLMPNSKDGKTVEWAPATRDESTLKTDYLPVPMWVNAHARRRLIDVCRANQDRLIYANTDGCMLLGHEPPKACALHPTELGKWKIAAEYDKVTILALNRYQGWKTDGGVDVVMAGNLFRHPIPYDQFRHGVEVVDDYGTPVML